MEYMEMKWVPVKNQRFSLDRSKNIFKCCDCECFQRPGKCDKFADCANYVLKTNIGKYSVKEFCSFYQDYYNHNGLTDELVGEFISQVLPKMPKGLYWESEKGIWDDKVIAVKYGRVRKDYFAVRGIISNMESPFLKNYDLSVTEEKYLKRVIPKYQQMIDIFTNGKEE